MRCKRQEQKSLGTYVEVIFDLGPDQRVSLLGGLEYDAIQRKVLSIAIGIYDRFLINCLFREIPERFPKEPMIQRALVLRWRELHY